MQKVLIAGATGDLGKFVLQVFKKRGYWVRALTRDAERLESLKDYIDEIIDNHFPPVCLFFVVVFLYG